MCKFELLNELELSYPESGLELVRTLALDNRIKLKHEQKIFVLHSRRVLVFKFRSIQSCVVVVL